LFAALSTTPHLPTEAYSSEREEDAQGIDQRKTRDRDEDYSSDSDEEDKDSVIDEDTDKENSSPIQKRPSKNKRKKHSVSSKRSLPKTSSSTTSKRKKKRRPVSDESSAKSSSSQTSRSVLSDSSRSHLQARRVSDSQGLTTMAGTRYQEQKRNRDAIATPVDDDDSSSSTEEPPVKKRKMTKDQQITALQQQNTSHEATIMKQARMITTRDDKITDLEVIVANLKRQQKKKLVGVPENTALKLVVKTYTTSHVWTWYKFIADEDELDEIMERILLSCEDGVKILSKVDGADKQEARKELLRSYSLTYGPDICKAINGKRSTTQSALFKAVMDRIKEGKRVPRQTVFLKIIRRKGLQYRTEEGAEGPTPDNIEVVDSNREVFDWYVDQLLDQRPGQR
jgi:hypothetical protein